MEEEAGREESSGSPSLMVFLTNERQHQEQKQEAKRQGRAMAIHKILRSNRGESGVEGFINFWSFIFYLTFVIRD